MKLLNGKILLAGLLGISLAMVAQGAPVKGKTPATPSVVVIPKPQKMVIEKGSLLLKGNLTSEDHYRDVENRIEKTVKALPDGLGIKPQEKRSIPLFLGVKGTEPAVSKRLQDEGLTLPDKPEAYALSVSGKGITIIGNDIKGLFYGLMTLRQLKQGKDGNTSLPYVKIEDYPALAYRGVHFFTGKDALKEQKALVDVMALHKMNNVVFQLDFMEFKKHPELWYDQMGEKQSEVKELIKYCNDRFIEVTPMVNTPGHAEWIFRNGVHLDICEDPNPTKEGATPYAIYINNDSTYTFLFELYDEVIDLFKPKYFHIGHDEPDLPDYVKFPGRSQGFTTRELIEMDIRKNAEYFKNKNIDIMLWGDTLLYRGESPDACNAKTKDDAIQLRKMLKEIEAQPGAPKFIICDWHYASARPEQYKSLGILKKEGFEVLACPWYGRDNILFFNTEAVNTKSLGLLQTTWAGFNFSIEANTSCYEQFSAYLLAADYSWSGRKEKAVNLEYNADKVFFEHFKAFKQGKESLQAE
jgi:hypothetical protein